MCYFWPAWLSPASRVEESDKSFCLWNNGQDESPLSGALLLPETMAVVSFLDRSGERAAADHLRPLWGVLGAPDHVLATSRRLLGFSSEPRDSHLSYTC